MAFGRLRVRAWIVALAASLFVAGAFANENTPPPPLYPRAAAGTGKRDPLMDQQWHLNRVRAFEAWNTTQGKPSTVVAVVDSGIDYNNVELSPNITWNNDEIGFNHIDDDGNGLVDDVIGWDFVRMHPAPWDRSGHGTFMAGLIAAVQGNGEGISGVCPRCGLLPVRVLNYEGSGSTKNCIRGIRYAISRHVSIINYSVSGEGYDKDMESAIREADAADILVVVAASNDGEDDDKNEIYPAHFNLPNLITVTASTKDNELLHGSNWGKHTVHLAAPGEDVMSIWFGKYDVGSGTSDATAVASGVAGLVRSANPSLSARTVKNIILSTAHWSPALKNKTITGGVIDAAAAVECATNGLDCLR